MAREFWRGPSAAYGDLGMTIGSHARKIAVMGLGRGGNREISLFPVSRCLPCALYRRNDRGEKALDVTNETWA